MDNNFDILMQDAKAREAADLSMARGNRDLWERAVVHLSTELPNDTKNLVRVAIAANPENWIAPYHFFWGMSIRNLLRETGYGEKEFGINNLDNIYVALVEEAVRKS